MENTNKQSGNSKIAVAPRQVGKIVLRQVQNSLYSKAGKTTLTGRFEDTPKNKWASSNQDLIDSIAKTKSDTYLQSLKTRQKPL